MRAKLYVILILVACTAWAQVPVVGGAGTSLKGLAGTDTFVTVVLKDSGAMDPNLRVVSVNPAYIEFASQDGESILYNTDAIKEIQVQSTSLKQTYVPKSAMGGLTRTERELYDRTETVARDIFDKAGGNQMLKSKACITLGHHGVPSAVEYLTQLVKSNDLDTAIDAAFSLYLIGQTQDISGAIRRGMESADRRVRTHAALLAGLAGETEHSDELNRMLQSRAADFVVPAALSLARLGNRDGVPSLIDMIDGLNEPKAEAAVVALSQLGGSDVVESLKIKLQGAQGGGRFRILRVLYALGDPAGAKGLIEDFDVPGYGPEAAVILARDGNPEALHFMRNYLSRRPEPELDKILFRARAAAGLVDGGDASYVSTLQDLIGHENPAVKFGVLLIIARSGNRLFMPLAEPVILSANPMAALAGCEAVIACADPEFRKRMLSLTLE